MARVYAACAACLLAVTTSGAVIITEFMATNDSYEAGDGRSTPDWIELYNTGPDTVSLEDWVLTDNANAPGKWRFPAVALPPNAFLVVYASGRDLRRPGRELHTSFRLDATGEYLALFDPSGAIASEFAPAFPPQFTDVSFGLRMETSGHNPVSQDTQIRYAIPASTAEDNVWMQPDFDDSGWQTGVMGIGYDRNSPPVLEELIATNIHDQLYNVNPSVRLRMEFTLGVEDLDALYNLRVKFADGFVAYLNGVEIARENFVGSSRYNRRAALDRPPAEALIFSDYRLGVLSDLLVSGRNVLAVQAASFARNNADFVFLAVLEAVQSVSITPGVAEYFEHPTPGWPNRDGVPGIAQEPVIGTRGKAFSEPFLLQILSFTGGDVRYTLDGSLPTRASALYSEPIEIRTTAIVQARTFIEGLLPSPISTQSFVYLHPSMMATSSNLPIVVVNTLGRAVPTNRGTCPIELQRVPFHLQVIERGGDGRAHMTGTPDFAGYGAIKRRGSSTYNRPKPSFNLEIRHSNGRSRDVSILGLPPESDFILYGPYNFDLALMRNAFIYEISNQCGRYATRSRFVEVWLNQSAGAVTSAHYFGVYSFMEKIKRGVDRVDVARLYQDDNEMPQLSGGYMFKIDRADDCVSGGLSGGGKTVQIIEPHASRVTPQQRAWLSSFLNQMNTAVRTRNLAQYEQYIDVQSWIDHHILMFFPKNVDAFRLSAYMFKDRDGLHEMGPIWDYDRSMGSTDGRDRTPQGWFNDQGGDGGTRYFSEEGGLGAQWYTPLFGGQPPLGNDDWARLYRARWRELRAGPLSTENLVAVIDGMAAEIGQAADRNWNKWRQGGSNYAANVATLRNWVTTRVAWIDSQFIEPPEFSHPGGLVPEGLTVAIFGSGGDVYYTVNGPDPRQTNGTVHPDAIRYTAPLLIDANVHVQARVRAGGTVWSEPASAVYYTRLAPIMVTELMYNPHPDASGLYDNDQYEFIEVFNFGDETVSLEGFRFVGTARFAFSDGDIKTLGPGEYVLAVRNREAFAARYGPGLPVAGVLVGGSTLSGAFSNSSQQVDLVGAAGEPLSSFRYRDTWYPTTDGGGYSLVVVDPLPPRENLDDPSSWKASAAVGGSPGGPESQGWQIPGDFSQDGLLTISDAVGLVRYLMGEPIAMPCFSADATRLLMDVNGDSLLNFSDAVYLLRHLFAGGPPPFLGSGCIGIAGCRDICRPSGR